MTTKVKETITSPYALFKKFKQLRMRDEEDEAREEEVAQLRRQLVPRFRNPFDNPEEQERAINYFVNMSSKLIKEVYLTHEVAYGYCSERANREKAKEKEDDETT